MKVPAKNSSYLELALIARVLDNSADAVEIDDLDGYIVYVNDSWCLLFSRRRDEVTGLRWDSFHFRGEDMTRLKDSWDKCIKLMTSRGTFRLNGTADGREAISYTRNCFVSDEGMARAVITIFRSPDDTSLE